MKNQLVTYDDLLPGGAVRAAATSLRKKYLKTLIDDLRRYTFACLAVEYGMPIDVLAKILGHSNVNMTRHYAKFSENLIGREMQEIGALLSM